MDRKWNGQLTPMMKLTTESSMQSIKGRVDRFSTRALLPADNPSAQRRRKTTQGVLEDPRNDDEDDNRRMIPRLPHEMGPQMRLNSAEVIRLNKTLKLLSPIHNDPEKISRGWFRGQHQSYNICRRQYFIDVSNTDSPST